MAGTVVGGRYTVGAYRGSGGSSDVYRAIDNDSGASVAIKIVRDGGVRTAARLERELTVARTIEHPNVVRMLDSGIHEGRPYLVMEFIDGPNLAERMRERGLLTIDEVIAIATQTLRGLAELHDRGVTTPTIRSCARSTSRVRGELSALNGCFLVLARSETISSPQSTQRALRPLRSLRPLR